MCRAGLTWHADYADEDARETMENLCSAALEFQATMYSLPIRAEYNVHVETLALFSKISTSVARQVSCPISCAHSEPQIHTLQILVYQNPGRILLHTSTRFASADIES